MVPFVLDSQNVFRKAFWEVNFLWVSFWLALDGSWDLGHPWRFEIGSLKRARAVGEIGSGLVGDSAGRSYRGRNVSWDRALGCSGEVKQLIFRSIPLMVLIKKTGSFMMIILWNIKPLLCLCLNFISIPQQSQLMGNLLNTFVGFWNFRSHCLQLLSVDPSSRTGYWWFLSSLS